MGWFIRTRKPLLTGIEKMFAVQQHAEGRLDNAREIIFANCKQAVATFLFESAGFRFVEGTATGYVVRKRAYVWLALRLLVRTPEMVKHDKS